MKQILSLLLISTAAVAAESKLCFYDPEQLASQSDEWRALVMDVDKRFQKEAEKIKSAEAEFQKSAQAFNTKAAVLGDAAREAETERLDRTKADLEHSAKRMVDEYQNARQKVNVSFYKKLDEGIVGYLETQPGIEAAIPKTPGVFLKKGVTDHTTAIASHMNREYKSRSTTLAQAPKATQGVVVAKK